MSDRKILVQNVVMYLRLVVFYLQICTNYFNITTIIELYANQFP